MTAGDDAYRHAFETSASSGTASEAAVQATKDMEAAERAERDRLADMSDTEWRPTRRWKGRKGGAQNPAERRSMPSTERSRERHAGRTGNANEALGLPFGGTGHSLPGQVKASSDSWGPKATTPEFTGGCGSDERGEAPLEFGDGPNRSPGCESRSVHAITPLLDRRVIWVATSRIVKEQMVDPADESGDVLR